MSELKKETRQIRVFRFLMHFQVNDNVTLSKEALMGMYLQLYDFEKPNDFKHYYNEAEKIKFNWKKVDFKKFEDGVDLTKVTLSPGYGASHVHPINVTEKIDSAGTAMILDVKTIDLNNINKEAFVPMPTGTVFDELASKRNGLMRGTVYIWTGESGSGKTTVTNNIGDFIKKNNSELTVGFISGEMDENDWTEECLDNPNLSSIPTVYLLNYLDAKNYKELLMEALRKWDYCVVDSFEVIIDQLKEIYGWTAKKAESELITMLRLAASEGHTLMVLQQFTKGGTFVGSNKIKHLLTGMVFLRFDKNGDRYLEFVKNRRGGHSVGKKLYYIKNKQTGQIEFDEFKFRNGEAIANLNAGEKEQLELEDGLFDNEIMKKAQENAERRELLKEQTEYVTRDTPPPIHA